MRELLAITAGIILCGFLHPQDRNTKPAVLFEKRVVQKKKVVKKSKKDLSLEAIARSKYPDTLKAIAHVESRTNPDSIGDNGDSYGLFHIQEKHWGPVPKSIDGQVAKAEEILDSLIKRYGYVKAIERWNGKGKGARQHRQRVLLAMKEKGD